MLRLLFLLLLPLTASADLSALRKKYETRLGSVSVREISTGRELLNLRGDQPLIPASTMKLFTSYVALLRLGGEYTFPTEFFLQNGVLSVRGHGDPSLTEERLYKVVDDLYRSGLREVQGIVLDSSLFRDPRPRTGLNPYQAANSALAVNFNSINVRSQAIGGRVVTSVTSFIPYGFENLVSIAGAGSLVLSESERGLIVVKGTVPANGELVEDNIAVSDPDRVFGNVLAGLLEQRGIRLNGSVRRGRVSGLPHYISRSKDLAQILADVNRFSSNFIANQVVYALGRGDDGSYSFDRGLRVIREEVQKTGIAPFELLDGAGLDRGNRASASGMTRLIAIAANNPALAPDFLASLSRYGNRGTLKRRKGVPEVVWGKTGYLSGVSSVAGTFPLESGLGAYAIITNNISAKDETNSVEDSFLRDLLRAVSAKH
jgi:D-alanyl-D-alanine carboxypeptidase/D-alanyl-D-alanine-endopeptidase (penicillin-binding protein 4)